MKFQNVAIFFSLVLFLLSCKPSEMQSTKTPEPVQHDPQVTVPTSTLVVPLDTPTEMLAPIPVSPNSTVVEFLVDKSGSVDDNCGEVGKKRFEFVNYMINILKKMRILQAMKTVRSYMLVWLSLVKDIIQIKSQHQSQILRTILFLRVT